MNVNVFRRRATKPTIGMKMNEKEMAKEIRRLDNYTLHLGVKIEELEKRLSQVQIAPLPPAPEPGEGVEVKGEHLIVEASSLRGRHRKSAVADRGIMVNQGEQIVATCNALNCVTPEHLEVMENKEARRFNSARVSAELETLSKAEVAFAIDALGTWISDGHFMAGDRMHKLPSGRNVSTMKAQVWASDPRLSRVPEKVKRTCTQDGCCALDHLKVDR